MGRNREDFRVGKRDGKGLALSADGSCLQGDPMISLTFEIEQPRAIGNDATPGIDTARLRQLIDAYNARKMRIEEMTHEKARKGTRRDESCNPEPTPRELGTRCRDRGRSGMRSASGRHTRVRTDRRKLKRCGVNYRKFVRGLESVRQRFAAVLGLDRGEEAVTAAGESLDKAGFFRVVRERRANLVDREVDAVFEIDKGGVCPQVQADLFARDHPAGALGEKLKQAEGLRLQP